MLSLNMLMNMEIESNPDLIISHTCCQLKQEDTDLLTLRDGKVLAIQSSAMALFSHMQAVHDELSGGLLAYCPVPGPLKGEGALVSEYRAGYVGLRDGSAVLITPVAIQLFPSPADALHNRNEICRLDLSAL